MSQFEYYREIKCGRRPKSESSFNDSLNFPNGEEEEEEEEEEENLDEEVNFDNPSFSGKGEQIWTDYAEDLDYDQ